MFPGANGIQVSVVQYGATNSQEVSWNDEQGKSNLLNLVERIPRRAAAAPALGNGHTSKHTHNDADTCCLTALPIFRFSPAVRRADGHFVSQRRKSRCVQGCSDAGD